MIHSPMFRSALAAAPALLLAACAGNGGGGAPARAPRSTRMLPASTPADAGSAAEPSTRRDNPPPTGHSAGGALRENGHATSAGG